MLDEIKKVAKRQVRLLGDLRNVALYIFVLIVLSIAWSSVKTIQSNYELQKKITALKQQNDVIRLADQNIELQNKYYQTDQYLELAARQSLGLAAPGEKVMTIPKTVAMKYVDPSLIRQDSPQTGVVLDNRHSYIRNLETWRDFLIGRNLTANN